jgi:ABC-type uncharacterized transport system permease subunit
MIVETIVFQYCAFTALRECKRRQVWFATMHPSQPVVTILVIPTSENIPDMPKKVVTFLLKVSKWCKYVQLIRPYDWGCCCFYFCLLICLLFCFLCCFFSFCFVSWVFFFFSEGSGHISETSFIYQEKQQTKVGSKRGK